MSAVYAINRRIKFDTRSMALKLTEGILRSLCKHYGIQEKNTDSLISQYMSKYGNCDVRSISTIIIIIRQPCSYFGF